MTENIEKEIEAIKTILTTLSPLDEETRKNVIEYVFKKLGLSMAGSSIDYFECAENNLRA